jgi:RecA-family ATPase
MTISDIMQDVDTHTAPAEQFDKSIGLFIIKTAGQWLEQANHRPIPRMLFGELWHESELSIFFADTNLGKSILAVQIGDSISKGIAIPGFKLEAEKQPIIYFDFELSDKQFENRYSIDYAQHYQFDDNFLRVEINPDADIPEKESFDSILYQSIEQSIIKSGARILIIDNLTYLKSATETSKDALPLMKELKTLKSKYGLSILCLAHTPKRDLTKPITRNDLAGSKMLINFCDSSFTIGESYSDKSLRYIKQIKQRNTEQLYDGENVITCQIDKPFNFLQFEFVDFGRESDHLKQCTDTENENISEKVQELKQQGKTLREIGSQLGISHMKVSRLLAKL